MEYYIDQTIFLLYDMMHNELQVGYNNEDITIFLPKELRDSEAFCGFGRDSKK